MNSSEAALRVARIVYGGVRGAHDTDSQKLEAIAEWMDRIDDVIDLPDEGRDMQHDLRRIAKNIEGLRWEGDTEGWVKE